MQQKFKKAEFAELVKENISSLEDVSDEIKEIIKELSADNKKEASASL